MFSRSHPYRLWFGFVLSCCIVAAKAATLTVTNLNDAGAGSLRAQIAAAASGDSIVFQSGLQGTITLASQLTINKSLTISGPSNQSAISVSGNSANRVFSVDAGVTGTIQRLTITNGMAPPGSSGGGVLNNGSLTLDSVIVSSNSALRGAGVFGNGGSLSIVDSTITGGTAGAEGGGVFAASGTVSLLRSTVSASSASSMGGGLYVSNAAVTVRQSTLASNSALSSGGGFALAGSGTLNIANSTISGNHSNSQGAGGFSSGGSVTLVNVTITANVALGLGGGIGTNSTVHATNTLISGNSASNGATADISGSLATSNSNLIGGSAVIGTLADNGFSTQTHALLPGSPAIGIGDTSACSAAPVSGIDQRGKPRPGGCSVGAYEPQLPFSVSPTAGSGQSAQINTAFAAPLQATLAEADGRPVPIAGISVLFTLPANGASASFAGGGKTSSVNTSAGGVAISPALTANATAGGWTAVASASGYSPAAFNLTNTSGGGGVATTTTLSSSQNPSPFGASVTFTATVTGNSPSGTVEFREGASVLGSGNLNGSGQATFTTSALALGDHTIVAAYLGNGANNASSSAPLIQSIGKTAQTITFAALPSRNLGDAPFTVSATASSGLSVSFASQTPGVCGVSGNTVTILTVGSCTVRASQAGNANFAAAPSVDRSFSIVGPNQTAQTITFAALSPRTFGDAPFTISASASSGLPVIFTPQTPTVCSVSINSVIILAAGTCTLRAEQSGNVVFAPATPVDQSFIVAKAAQSIVFDSIANKVYGTAPFFLSANATSALDVDYSSDSPAICAASIGGRVSLLAGGTCMVRASQAGNANYFAAPEATQSFNVSVPPGVVTLTYTPQNPIVGQPITFRLGVGGTNPSGSLTLKTGNRTLGTTAVTAGAATFTTSELAAGNHIVTVTYGGDGVNPATESQGFGLAVAPENVSSSGGGGGCVFAPHGTPESSMLLLLAGALMHRWRGQRKASMVRRDGRQR